jgi:uncharacterized protein (DUF1778 family)
MTARQQLHRVVDELPETEVEDALAFLASRTADSAEPSRIVVDDEYAERVIDAFENPDRFEPGLRRLVASAGRRVVEPR